MDKGESLFAKALCGIVSSADREQNGFPKSDLSPEAFLSLPSGGRLRRQHCRKPVPSPENSQGPDRGGKQEAIRILERQSVAFQRRERERSLFFPMSGASTFCLPRAGKKKIKNRRRKQDEHSS